MIRVHQAVSLAAFALTFAACSESSLTEPRAASAAARDVSNSSKPLPTVTCTVAPGPAGYEATVTWQGFSPISLQFFQGSTPVSPQYPITQAKHSGSMTVPLNVVPDYSLLLGRTIGAKTLCTLVS